MSHKPVIFLISCIETNNLYIALLDCNQRFERKLLRGGTMHGGFSAHLVLCLFHALWCIIMLTIWQSFSLAESLQVDSATTVALMTNEGGLPGVSVDMHMTYMKVKEESIFG